MFGGLTVDENLRLVDSRRRHRTPRSSAQLFPDLVARRKQRAGTLSGGQQQMVALARVSAAATTCCCSSTSRPRAWRRSSSPRSPTCWPGWPRTTPILLVEQNLPLVRRIADTVVVIDAGRVVHRGDAAALLADADLHPRAARRLAAAAQGGFGVSDRPSSSLVTGLGLGALYFLAASRAQPHLRPDGRAQLRPRRLHDRRRVCRLADDARRCPVRCPWGPELAVAVLVAVGRGRGHRCWSSRSFSSGRSTAATSSRCS